MRPAPLERKTIPLTRFRVVESEMEYFATSLPASAAREPLNDLASQPGKLEAALKTAKTENDALDLFAASTCAIRCNGAAQHSQPELKNVEFHLKAPEAKSVQLAADFTEWEKFPLELALSQDGVWFTVVPLPAGNYSYRFIVDGKWFDDPRPVQRVSNPFGTANAVIHIA